MVSRKRQRQWRLEDLFFDCNPPQEPPNVHPWAQLCELGQRSQYFPPERPDTHYITATRWEEDPAREWQKNWPWPKWVGEAFLQGDIGWEPCTGYGPAFTKINVMRKDLLDFFRVRGVRWRKEGEVEGRRRAGWTLEGRFEDTFVW